MSPAPRATPTSTAAAPSATRLQSPAAPYPTAVPVEWPEFHFDPFHTGFNPFETVLSTATVAGLATTWTGATGGDSGSAAVANGVVYVIGAPDIGLTAFDANGSTNCSGTPRACAPLWTSALSISGTSNAPAVANGVVYAGAFGSPLYAFDASGNTNCSGTPRTCSPLWTGASVGGISSWPTVANGVVYAGSFDHKLYAFDAAGSTNCSGMPETCAPLWTATTGNFVSSSPAVANGVVYVGSDDDKLYAFDAGGITNCSGTPRTCAPLWAGATGYSVSSSPAVVNGVVYVGSDKLYAFGLVAPTDTTPPSTTASVAPPLNTSGWSRTDVAITLSATDESGGSGVRSLSYSATGAQPLSNTTVLGSMAMLAFTAEGTTSLSYFATDEAGNHEATRTLSVRIDKTPPVTTTRSSPAPNAAGWNNQANVTITLNATDNLSGVAHTEFNLDSTGWTAYTAPISVSAEGKHTLQYRSVDVTDNVETTHLLPVNIDRTAPEASLQFDPTTKDILVFGHDALSGTPSGPVVPSTVTSASWGYDDEDDELGLADQHTRRVELRTYNMTDAAGNTLRLVLKVHTARRQTQVDIVSLQYNRAAIVEGGHNAERFEWDVDDYGILRRLNQQVRVGIGQDRQLAQAMFDARDDVTRIDVEVPRTSDLHVRKPGLVLLQTNTAQGGLSVTY